MGVLNKLFGILKSKKVTLSARRSGESERESSIEGNKKESSKSQYELRAVQKKEPPRSERQESADRESFATIGLQRLKSRAATQIRPDEEIVGDPSKPFSSYVKRKLISEKVVHSTKPLELVDLGKITSSFSKDGIEENFILLDNYSFAKSSQTPPPLDLKTPPPTSKETKPASEQSPVSEYPKDKLITSMDIPEASLTYHKERVEFKVESSEQNIESVLERFSPTIEPIDKRVDVSAKEQDSAKEIKAEFIKLDESADEKPKGKFKAGRIVQPPFKKTKKTLEDVLVMPKPYRPSYKRDFQKTFTPAQKPSEEVRRKEEKRTEVNLVNAFSKAFEALLSSDTSLPQEGVEDSQGLVEYHPDEVDDLNQMFLQMLSNYLKPLEDGFDTLERGEYDEETVAGLLGAVRPLRSAALTMNFERISELLKEIEEPLNVYRRGEIKKFRPTQLASMVLSYRELFKILPRAKVMGKPGKFSAANELLKVLKSMPEVTSEYIERLFACGFSSLDAVRSTLPYEISITCSIPEEIAYKIHNVVLENVEREV